MCHSYILTFHPEYSGFGDVLHYKDPMAKKGSALLLSNNIELLTSET